MKQIFKKLFCSIGWHWYWWKDYNCTYLPDLYAPIIEEMVDYRICAICGKKEILLHVKWNYKNRRFDTIAGKIRHE